MAVNLSPYGGVGAQFLDNAGNVLTGGKIFTYAAGTTTNQATYTTSAGNILHSNPIILDASGRVPSGGEIWLTDGLSYKFILRDANDVLIATYDNVTGINSNFVAFINQQEIQTATAGQTVFNLATTTYQPGTNSLSVFVDGVNQYGPGAQYAYLETDSDTVTFVTGLHVGAEVKFTTSQLNSSGLQANAFQVSYTPPFTNSVTTNVGDKLAETVSVQDFGAIGDGVTDDTVAIQAAIAASSYVYVPEKTYLVNDSLNVSELYGSGNIKKSYSTFPVGNVSNTFGFQTLSTARLGANVLNPTASWTDGRYMYLLSQGSYASTTQAYLHILDIENSCRATLISSFALGTIGTNFRALSVSKNYAYAQTTGGVCFVINIADKANPTLATTITLNSGNRQEAIFYGDLLIIPKQTGDVDFYVVNEYTGLQLKKTITAVGSWYQPILDGANLWVVGYNNGSADNLLCINVEDYNNINVTSSTTIATMNLSRYVAIKGKYLYVGGFDTTPSGSKLNVIDISDATAPVAVYTSATDNALAPVVAGNYLIDSLGVYDITNPILPVKIQANFPLYRPTCIGSYAVGSIDGDGLPGPSSIDGKYNPGLSVVALSGISVGGITAGGGQFQNVYTETARIRGNADVGGLIVGPTGINTDGPITTNNATNISGIRKYDFISNKLVRPISGDISSPTLLCYIHQLVPNNNLQVRIKYTHVLDITGVALGQIGIGEVYGAFIISSLGVVFPKLAFTDAITARNSGVTAMPLTVTLVDGTGVGGTPVAIQVSSTNMNSANSRASYEVEVLGTGQIWLSKA
jgi:hypothetical protein